MKLLSKFSALTKSATPVILIVFTLAFSKVVLAEEWEVTEGKTALRYCKGSQVVYSTSQPKDFELCLSSEDKGSFNKVTAPLNVTKKSFTDGGEVSPMTDQERKQMAQDLKSIQARREKEEPHEILKEINKIAKSWKTDAKFRQQVMENLTPEEKELVKQLNGLLLDFIINPLQINPNKRERKKKIGRGPRQEPSDKR